MQVTSPSCINIFIENNPDFCSKLENNTPLFNTLIKSNLTENTPLAFSAIYTYLGESIFKEYAHHHFIDCANRIRLMHFAALGGQISLTKSLSSNYTWDLQDRDDDENTILDYAIQGNQPEFIAYLQSLPGFEKAQAALPLMQALGPQAKLVKTILYLIKEENLIAICNNPETLQSFTDAIAPLFVCDFEELYAMHDRLQTIPKKTIVETEVFILVRLMWLFRTQYPNNCVLEDLSKIMKYTCNSTPLGNGSFGAVFKVDHIFHKNSYAIKTQLPYEKTDDIAITRQQAKNERNILQILKKKDPNHLYATTRIVEWIQNWNGFENVLILKLEGENLSWLIKNPEIVIMPTTVQKIMKQIFTILTYLESIDLVHTDLKPANFLCKPDTTDEIVLADFGSSFFLNQKPNPHFIPQEIYQSLFYRSPECASTRGNYTCAIDVWSAGCIGGELLFREPLFNPTSDNDDEALSELTQLHKKLLGPYIHYHKNDAPFFGSIDEEKTFTPNFQDEIFSRLELFNPIHPSFIDLLEDTLKVDDEDRILAKKALEHSFFKEELS